jgi:acetolactate synthase-1/2/3 large subunit
MRVADAIAEILRREGVDAIFGYPRNPILEAAAKVDIRTIIVRQERTGVHMADALSRISSGDRIGVFTMQTGPGTENSFGGVAQAFADSVPLVVLPGGAPREIANIRPNFSAFLNYQHITKWIEQPSLPEAVPGALRRAFTQARNGRPAPTLVEVPRDLYEAEIPEPLTYARTTRHRVAPDRKDVSAVAAALVAAKRPIIYAGQGIHYAKAWPQLQAVAELLAAPVFTSFAGKSAFNEAHPLALGSGGLSFSKQLRHFLTQCDLIFGIGCSFSTTDFGIAMPKDKTVIHATLDPADLNKDIASESALLGDAGLALDLLLEELRDRLRERREERLGEVVDENKRIKSEWLSEWMPYLTSKSIPLSPYRIIWDLLQIVDRDNTIITHDSGNPRNQLAPFWECRQPLSYIGWGKSTQLGYGLGLAMGAKIAKPDKLCINVWGDAAIGFTGMDIETAVREHIPILSILFNNSTMATEHRSLVVAAEKYRATDIGGNYADFARSLGAWSEKVIEPNDIIPAIRRGIAKTLDGVPALIEFITERSTKRSHYR